MDTEDKLTDRLIVTVDGQVHEIPIFVWPAAPNLQISPQIDFGILAMANKVVTKQININNEGSKIGEFKLLYNGNRPLNIVPNEGIVYPQSTVSIQIEYVTHEAHKIDERCQAVFENQEPFEITICGEIVQRSLEILDLNFADQKQLKCIKFPDTYYGSDKSEVGMLFNNSPENIQFVAILDEDAVGQESGAHISMTASGINPKECTNPLTSLITMYPNQGNMGPYEKIPVLFRFSPRWNLPKQAFKKTLEPPLQQTFAVFIKIQIVGSGIDLDPSLDQSEIKEDSLAKSQQLEVAVTGTAAPVLIELLPESIDFGECYEKGQLSKTLMLCNRSALLSCSVEFTREAHFVIEPKSIRVGPNEQVEINAIFNPKQYGNLTLNQPVKVLSYVKSSENPFIEYEQVIHEQFFKISGSCIPIKRVVEPKFCNGTDPIITNNVGLSAETSFCNLGSKPQTGPRAAYITQDAFGSGGTNGSKLFRCIDATTHPYNNRTAQVAFPNDRAGSIRPFEQSKDFRTILKRIKRYNYVDPDYAYTDEEMRMIRQHQDAYQTLIRKQHFLKNISRLNAQFANLEDDLNLGIIPANGLMPPRLKSSEIGKEKLDSGKDASNFKLLSTKDLKQSDKVIDISKLGTFNAIPTTDLEKEQCIMVLSPQKLHEIVIGPSTINFGEVSVKSLSNKEISVVNNLDQFIHVSIVIDCNELRQSSPLSQVIPAKTKSIFPLVFESNKKGKFQRNLSYVINGYYQNHVIVLANVVLNQLQLSTDCLFLSSTSIYPPDSGIRNTITMTNPLNCATEFLWEPVFSSSNGIAFSIRPKEGIVEAFSKLDCEVVFHPSFMAPSEGEFILRIPGNVESNMENSLQDTVPSGSSTLISNDKPDIILHCVANLGIPHVIFQTRRVMFGNIPINLVTVKTAILQNTGGKHAYFRIITDQFYEEYPGMVISPLKGSIPVGGQVELTIEYLPTSLIKFDCSFPIIIRGWKELELKLSGTVILPQLEISQKKLEFGGVPVGSEKILNFNLINKSHCRAEVEFDFERQKDFQVACIDPAENETPISNERGHVYQIIMKPLQDLNCQLRFNPIEVASYEFPLSIKVNQVEISAPPQPRGQTGNSNASSKQAVKTIIAMPTLATSLNATDVDRKSLLGTNLVRNVIATATRRPINISNTNFHFQFVSKFEAHSHCKKLVISNNVENQVEICLKFNTSSWKYGTESSIMKTTSSRKHPPFQFSIDSTPLPTTNDFMTALFNLGEAMKLDISFEPDVPGHYSGEILVFINNNFEHAFQRISLSGFLDSPQLICQPEHLCFICAPLKTRVSVDFKLIAVNFEKETFVNVTLPVITRPGTNESYQPFECTFLTSNEVRAMSHESRSTEIRGTLTFFFETPINIRSVILFSTESGVTESVDLSASADNCQLSWQPFVRRHHMEYHIVCDEGKHLEGTELLQADSSSDFGEPQLKMVNKELYRGNGMGNNTLQSRNSTTVTSSNFEESSVTYEETVSESESAYFGTPVAIREGALNNFEDKAKYKSSVTPSLKQNQKPADGSIVSTLDMSSSVMSDKNFVSVHMPPNIILNFVNEESGTTTTDSSVIKDFDIPTFYDAEILLVVQRWFVMHGWPGNLHPTNVPISFRSSLQKRFGYSQTTVKDKSSQKLDNMENTGLKSESRDVYDMILYLTNRQIMGINTTVTLPSHPVERACHIYIQHATLLAFLESHGGQLAQIRPEHLMDPAEYDLWYSVGCPGLENKKSKCFQVETNLFEKISKKAWTSVLLQILKVFILTKVTYKSYKQALQILHGQDPIPDITLTPTISNCYSLNERILLAWLNYLYESLRHKCWSTSNTGDLGITTTTPAARWIINFDNDFMDSLILATAIAAYVPFMIEQHFKYMYSNPQNPEQCLHNALKIVNALKNIGMEFDIQAIDIVDPNPIMMILFTLNLFQSLPLYLPKSEIVFSGVLHEQITKHIQISNPTSKALTYECIIIGNDANDFSAPKGNIINLPGKSSVKWPIVFKSRFMRSAEATVMFVGRKSGSVIPANLIFSIKSKITTSSATKVEKITGKCYVMKKISLKIVSPYNKGGDFKIKLLENSDSIPKVQKDVEQNTSEPQSQMKQSLNKKITLDSIKCQNKLRAFSCHCDSVRIDDNKVGFLELYYLPFHMGVKRCTLILSNESIGEFIHLVEATAELPEPIIVSPPIDKSKVWVSAVEAANRGLEGNENTIYWKCEVGSTVQESISIPISNPHKINALNAAAKLHLSPQEVSRRQITGTLNSSSLFLTAINVLTLSNEDQDDSTNKQNKRIADTKYSNKGRLINFEIESDSTFYITPQFVQIPDFLLFTTTSDLSTGNKNAQQNVVNVPIKFHAAAAGVYPCNLVFKGPDDVRLYRIECTVTPEGNLSQIFFKVPLQDYLSQNIPIVNRTKQDWPLRAKLTGSITAFMGPDFLMAKALTVSNYPLQFKPTKEGKVNAKLSLFNENDGSEHVFELFGEGESPLALDSLFFECTVGEKLAYKLQIPNSTKKKHLFSVESDLDWMISGEDSILILPGQMSIYDLTITPKCSGRFTGILAFVSGRQKIIEYDSDGDEIQDVYNETNRNANSLNNEQDLYRLWYSITMEVHPGPSQQTIEIESPCLQTKIIDIPISNPLQDDQMKLTAKVDGPYLSGPETITIDSKSTYNYSLEYKPSAIGNYTGRIMFYNETVGEFWFNLILKCVPVVETVIPVRNCELGKWSLIEIPIKNTDKSNDLLLYPEISNPDCFSMHIQDLEFFDQQRQCLSIPPNSEHNLSIRFTPCEIGTVGHTCLLNFKSKVLGDWKFHLTGCGLPPVPSDVIGVTAEAESNMTVLIPFHNPLLDPVLIDIKIVEEKESVLNKYRIGSDNIDKDFQEIDSGIFKILLKNNRKVKLESKQSIEIPISFAPHEMRKYDAICSVVMRRKNGKPLISDEDFESLILPNTEIISTYDKNVLRWLFPIKGIPVVSMSQNVFTTPLVQGPLRVETKERLEFSLSGLPPPVIKEDPLTKSVKSAPPLSREGNDFEHQTQFLQDFTVDLKVVNVDSGDAVDSLVLNEYVRTFLVKQSKQLDTGISLLTYEVRMKPLRKFKLNAEFVITSVSGGVWRFPVRFVAHDCEPDDEVIMEAIGLNKPVSVKFHLNSKTFEELPFKAYFLKGGDPDFSVYPTTGILPPIQSYSDSSEQGLPFIVTWTPKTYSRSKGARLVIETKMMEWVYKFVGITPQYVVPNSNSLIYTKWSKDGEPERKEKFPRKKNFLRQNIELLSTAVSSPIKGAPFFPRIV